MKIACLKTPFKLILLFYFLFFLSNSFVFAQENDTTSLVVKGRVSKKVSDSSSTKKRLLPKTVALFAAILPGSGQFINRKYWKIPIIYGGGLALVYFASLNNGYYLDFKTSYDSKTNPTLGIPDPFPQYSTQIVQVNRDKFKRDREFLYIMTFFVYALQIVDATVDAHLKSFDLSDDLSLRFAPSMEPIYSITPQSSVGIKLVLQFKK